MSEPRTGWTPRQDGLGWEKNGMAVWPANQTGPTWWCWGRKEYAPAGHAPNCDAAMAEAEAHANMPTATEVFIDVVRAQLERAREKYPATDLLAVALLAEAGELANALLREGSDQVYLEAAQVAALAGRIAIDGDHTVDQWRERQRRAPIQRIHVDPDWLQKFAELEDKGISVGGLVAELREEKLVGLPPGMPFPLPAGGHQKWAVVWNMLCFFELPAGAGAGNWQPTATPHPGLIRATAAYLLNSPELRPTDGEDLSSLPEALGRHVHSLMEGEQIRAMKEVEAQLREDLEQARREAARWEVRRDCVVENYGVLARELRLETGEQEEGDLPSGWEWNPQLSAWVQPDGPLVVAHVAVGSWEIRRGGECLGKYPRAAHAFDALLADGTVRSPTPPARPWTDSI